MWRVLLRLPYSAGATLFTSFRCLTCPDAQLSAGFDDVNEREPFGVVERRSIREPDDVQTGHSEERCDTEKTPTVYRSLGVIARPVVLVVAAPAFLIAAGIGASERSAIG